MMAAGQALAVILCVATAAAQDLPACASDMNRDGEVSVADILLVLASFGSRDAFLLAQGDVNADGRVNVSDILLVLSSFGTTECSAGLAIPAPAPPTTRPPTGGGHSGRFVPWKSPDSSFSGGRVFGLGDNDDGRLGVGDSGNQHHDPVEAVTFGSDVVAIAAGGHQTFALKSDGRVFAAGVNDYGQLGDGTTTDRSTAAAITALGPDIVEMASGLFNSMMVRTTSGQIYGWGANGDGELCLGSTDAQLSPIQITALGSDNVAIGAGVTHVIFVKNAGNAVGCGNGGNGALGSGEWAHYSSPVAIDWAGDVTQISGAQFTSHNAVTRIFVESVVGCLPLSVVNPGERAVDAQEVSTTA